MKTKPFNASTLKVIYKAENERLKAEETNSIKKYQAFVSKNIRKLITSLPEQMRKQLPDLVREGKNQFNVMSCTDERLGVRYVNSNQSPDKQLADIGSFEAVKQVVAWAKRKKFGHKINTCNGHWALFLTLDETV